MKSKIMYATFLLTIFISLFSNCSVLQREQRVNRQLQQPFLQTDNSLIFNRLITNRDYIIYLHWLRRTYGISYFERVFAALPEYKQLDRQRIETEYHGMGELSAIIPVTTRLTKEYLFHPKYYHYPVTGLDERQIFEFGKWMMDRYNENSLIQRGVYNYNGEQMDEDNFITESYLAGQYMGSVRKQSIKNWSEGIFLPLFRPPTEGEVMNTAEYLSQIGQATKPIKHDFLSIWERAYGIKAMESGIKFNYDFIAAPKQSYTPQIKGIYVGESKGYYESYDLDLATIIATEDYPFEEKNQYGMMPFTIVGSTKNNIPLVIDNRDLFENISPSIKDEHKAVLLVVNY